MGTYICRSFRGWISKIVTSVHLQDVEMADAVAVVRVDAHGVVNFVVDVA